MAESKKQIPLRVSVKLYEALAARAEDDFRSVNGQIEYLLTECVKQRRKNGGYVSKELDKPLDLEFLGEDAWDSPPSPDHEQTVCSKIGSGFHPESHSQQFHDTKYPAESQ